MQIFMWTVSLSLLAPSSEAKPAVIYGNAYGLWSPTHPHLTNGNVKPKTNTPVRYVMPEPETEPEVVSTPTPDVCPTLQSASHLCPPK